MPNFTTEDLLIYMYDEMESSEQISQLEQALNSDWALKQKFRVLVEAQEKLQKMPLRSPRTSTVDFILRYAEKNLHLSN